MVDPRRPKTDFTNIKCCICERYNLTSKTALREYNEKGCWTRNWFCRWCYDKRRYRKEYRYITGMISGSLDPNSTSGKGRKFERLTSTWRNVRDLNLEISCRSPIDHSVDSKLGMITTKGAFFGINKTWLFNFVNEIGKEFDNVICYCISRDSKKVERIYIFPRKEVINRKYLSIYKNSSRITWYEKYRLENEEELRRINFLWKQIMGD